MAARFRLTLPALHELLLAANARLVETLDNAVDWLLLRGTLVKSGLTPYETIYAGELMSVRFYPAVDAGSSGTAMARRPDGASALRLPLVLVPPLGVTTDTFDLLPGRSLAATMAGRGLPTYVVDWGRPERRHAALTMKDYAREMLGEALAAVRRHSGQPELSLFGWCMGGLLALLYLGFTRDIGVRNLVTVASPIDMRGTGIVARAAHLLDAPARLIRKFSRFRLHDVDAAWLASPGWATTLAFKLTDPIGSLTTYWDLLTRLSDREYVEGHATTSAYLDHMLLYPGGVLQDMVVKVAVDNQLAAGKVELRGEVADLTAITANCLAFAGDHDVLVPPEVARSVVDIVSSRDKSFRIAPGGHMGVIIGSRAPEGVWKPAADWLLARSDALAAPVPAALDSQAAARKRRGAEDPTV